MHIVAFNCFPRSKMLLKKFGILRHLCNTKRYFSDFWGYFVCIEYFVSGLEHGGDNKLWSSPW